MPWAVALTRSPMPIPSHPKQWHNCSGCVFLSCWVAGSVLKSWRHVSWQSTASAECGRMRSPQVLPYSAHSPELWGDPMDIQTSIKTKVFASLPQKKIQTVQKQPIDIYKSVILKKCHDRFYMFLCQYHRSPWHQSAILQKFRDQIETIFGNGIIDGHMPLLIRAVWIGFSWRCWW